MSWYDLLKKYLQVTEDKPVEVVPEVIIPPKEETIVETIISSPVNTLPEQIEEAKKYIGWSEDENYKDLKKLLGTDPVANSWCAAFVNTIEKKCGRKGTDSLSARSYLKYGKKTNEPRRGDIVVFWRGSKNSWQGHVAYYMSETDTQVRVLGGNQENMVKYKWYDKTRVLDYRRPA